MGQEVPASPGVGSPGGPPEDTGPTPPGPPPRDAGPAPSASASEDDETRSLLRSTAVMSVGTTLSRITGFLRVASMAFALGVAETRLNDSYSVANNLPNIVYELILGGILTSVAVPVFVEQIRTRREDEAWDAARAVMTVSLVLLAAVMVIGILAAPWIVRLYTIRVPPQARPEVQALATFLLRLFMPQILLYGMAAVATSLLNAHRRFAVPMFAPILNNLVVIASMLLFAVMPVPNPGAPSPANITFAQKLVLGIGTTAGVAAMAVALWPSLRRIGFRWRWSLRFRHEAVRKLIRLSGWAVAYVALNQLGLLVVIVLAGKHQGGYAAYQAAFIFFQLPYAIFSVSIMTALLPSLSEDWVRGDREDFRRTLARGVRGSAFVVVPAAVGYVVLARPIVRLLLEHGVAGAASTDLVAGVLVYFSLGLFSFSAFLLFLRAFYAMQDTRTPALINFAALVINVVANLALFPVLDVRGLALGHAIAYTFAAVAAGAVLRRRLGGLEGPQLGSGLAKILAGALATGAAAWAAAAGAASVFGVRELGDQLVQVGSGVLAGLIVFLGAALLFRMEELDLIRRTLRTRLRR